MWLHKDYFLDKMISEYMEISLFQVEKPRLQHRKDDPLFSHSDFIDGGLRDAELLIQQWVMFIYTV